MLLMKRKGVQGKEKKAERGGREGELLLLLLFLA